MSYEWVRDEQDKYERYMYADWDAPYSLAHFVEIIFGDVDDNDSRLTGWHMATNSHSSAWTPIPGPPRDAEEAKAVALSIWRMS